MDSYEQFLASKATVAKPCGLETIPELNPKLFPFQRDIVAWALKRGKACLFASTGLGKTIMQLEWAHRVAEHTGGRVLVLAPLAVASQTAAEGNRFGIDVSVARDASEVRSPITVTNYDRLHRFDTSQFVGVVCDESSCIKHHEAATLRILMNAFADTPFKLCATATPAPNDHTELGTHAEFMGVRTRPEMLSEFFVHDSSCTQAWRLKGHARRQFWSWVASWGVLVRKPSDLGYEDGGFGLPALHVHQHVIAADQATAHAAGRLFVEPSRTLNEQRAARKASLPKRVAECAERVNATPGAWVVWCDLNAESEALAKAIDGAVEVRGSMTIDEKESALEAFGEGRARVIVTKPSISGWGLNWQHCHQMAFVGVTHSWEAYYQAIRRCWRFGQTSEVNVHVYAGEMEINVLDNLRHKELEAERMAQELSQETADAVRANVRQGTSRLVEYIPTMNASVPAWMAAQ